MLFTELRFLWFFALVFVGHWALRGDRLRKLWLLLASYGFYAGWDWRFLSLILTSTLVDYAAGLGIARAVSGRGRRGWLIVSLVVNLGLLGVFKYFNFFLQSAGEMLSWLGLATSPRVLAIILPVGISFYTFQTLSYTIDVYRGRVEATRSLLDLSLFVAFFPQLVAGPIVRAANFLPQLGTHRRFTDVAVRHCLTLFLFGYVKKACIADNLALAVDPAFANPASFGSLDLALAMLLYGVQIYCDFSGYSDMAIAIGGLLGYRLPINFAHPYLAPTMTDFWRRWHISLSTWFRDYLYVPLGGNRRGTARTVINLWIVFLLCGLWHGASWNFVLWGAVHGAVLSVERFAGSIEPVRGSRWLSLGRTAVTQLVVMLAWVPFRAADLPTALGYLSRMVGAVSGADALPSSLWGVLAGLAVLHWLAAGDRMVVRAARLRPAPFAAAYGAAFALVLPFVAADYRPFVYFQF